MPLTARSRRFSQLKRSAIRRSRHGVQGGLFGRLVSAVDARLTRPLLVQRAVANGLNRDELISALSEAGSLGDLSDLLYEISSDLFGRARYWDDLGLKPRARDHYLESSLWAFYAQFVQFHNLEFRHKIYSQCADAYRRAAPYFQHAGEAIAIPYQTSWLSGFLRLPNQGEDAGDGRPAPPLPASGRYPCVLILNAFNSSKEELHFTENAFLNLGLATLSFDYPGLGECADMDSGALLDEHLGNALYLFLASRPNIDPERLGVLGLSLGGVLALRLAVMYPGRFRAIATLSTPLYHKTSAPAGLPGFQKHVSMMLGGAPDLVRDVTYRFSVGDGISEIACPILVAGGGRDPLTLAEETKAIYEMAGGTDKKLILCPRAGHNMYEMMPSLRYEIAQWINQRI